MSIKPPTWSCRSLVGLGYRHFGYAVQRHGHCRLQVLLPPVNEWAGKNVRAVIVYGIF